MRKKLSTLTPLQQRLCAFLVIGVLGQLTPFLSRLPIPLEVAWAIDLPTHWQLVWLTLSLVPAIVLSVQLRRVLPWVPFVIGASAAWFSSQPETLRISQGPHETLTVVTANLNVSNNDLRSLRSWLERVNADVVILQEVSPVTALELKRWDEFETRSIVPSEDPFGMAVLARGRPFEIDWQTAPERPPFVQLSFQFQGHQASLYGIHPMPPISPTYHDQRNALLVQLKQIAKNAPTIVAGDFNATPWSSAMPQDTLFRALPLTPSWQYVLPIDQILGTKHWSVAQTGVGPDIGSDHRPVWASLTLD